MTLRLLLLLFLLSAGLSVQAEDRPLKLGIFPYLSAAQLIELHKPLADYLSRRLDRPVSIASASTFPDFLQRSRNGQYDLVLTAPHMGALHILRDGFQPLAVAENRLYAVIASNRNSSWQRLDQVRDAHLLLPPPKAIVSLLALDRLKAAGIDLDSLAIRHTRSHDNALQSVLKGRSDIAAFSSATWQRYLDQGGDELRVLATSASMPGNFLVANPELDPALVGQLRQALWQFGQSAEGERYFMRTRQQGFRPVLPNDLQRLRPYLKRIFGY